MIMIYDWMSNNQTTKILIYFDWIELNYDILLIDWWWEWNLAALFNYENKKHKLPACENIQYLLEIIIQTTKVLKVHQSQSSTSTKKPEKREMVIQLITTLTNDGDGGEKRRIETNLKKIVACLWKVESLFQTTPFPNCIFYSRKFTLNGKGGTKHIDWLSDCSFSFSATCVCPPL